MDILNLTPHEVVVCLGDKKVSFPSVGQVRLSQKEVPIGAVNGIPLVKVEYGEPSIQAVFEPDLQGKAVIVSALVGQNRDAVEWLKKKGVKMILVPNTGPSGAIRDESGKIICVKSFIRVD